MEPAIVNRVIIHNEKYDAKLNHFHTDNVDGDINPKYGDTDCTAPDYNQFRSESLRLADERSNQVDGDGDTRFFTYILWLLPKEEAIGKSSKEWSEILKLRTIPSEVVWTVEEFLEKKVDKPEEQPAYKLKLKLRKRLDALRKRLESLEKDIPEVDIPEIGDIPERDTQKGFFSYFS